MRSRKAAPALASSSVNEAVKGPVGKELETLDANGVAPRTRIKSAKAGHQLWMTLLAADDKSARNRAILQDMADGAPPQPDSTLQQMGMGWVYNLNFLEADTHMVAALTSYDDLADSSEHLVVLDTEPNVLPPDDLVEATDVVCEEHAKLIREQSEFYSTWQILAKEFVGHGVGFGTFSDEETWVWDAVGWDQAWIPRKTRATEESIGVFVTRKEYGVHELWKFIEDQQYASNWDENEVKRAIVGASRGAGYRTNWMRYWPKIQEELKNNDLGFGLGDAEMVQTLHYRFREFDGSYTFAIGLEDGTNIEWLYLDANRYPKATDAFVSFTLGVGNRTYHSIRGLLWKLHPGVQTSNRFRNKMLTNTDVAMTLLLQGEEGDSFEDLMITLGPAFGYMPPGAKVVDRKLPDLGTQAMPVLNDLSETLSKACGQFQSPSAASNSPGGGELSGNAPKYAWQSQQAHVGALTSNSVARFYRSLDKLTNTQFTRLQKIGPTGKSMEGGGARYPEVKEFYERCKERLEPIGIDAVDFIQKGIRRVYAARAIGNGSPQMRLLALDELTQMQGALDETGRDFVIRDRIALRFGRAAADRYKPKVKRLAPDVKIALLENGVLMNEEVPVLPDENHAVHAGIHVPKFQDVVEQIVAYREQDPEADFKPMEPQLQYGLRLHDHASEHVQGMAADPSRVQDMKSYRAALEQGANLLMGLARELQQQERHQIDSNGGAGDANAQQDAISESNPKLTLEIQRQKEELIQARETHAAAQQLASYKVAQVAQSMKLKQIETDNKIAQQARASQSSAPV